MESEGTSIKLREIELTAFALGELQEPDRSRLEAELEHDPQGREFVQEVKQTASMVGDELAKESGPGLSDIHRLAIAGHLQEMMGLEPESIGLGLLYHLLAFVFSFPEDLEGLGFQ